MKKPIFSVFLLVSLVCSSSGQQLETAAKVTPQQPGQLAAAAVFPSGSPEPEMDSVLPSKLASVADKHEQRVRRLWYASIGMMLAGNTADAMTSWHKREANGLLASNNGTFGGKAIGIKAGVSAAILMPQILFRHHPELRKEFIIGNLIDAALFGGTAAHNAGISKP